MKKKDFSFLFSCVWGEENILERQGNKKSPELPGERNVNKLFLSQIWRGNFFARLSLLKKISFFFAHFDSTGEEEEQEVWTLLQLRLKRCKLVKYNERTSSMENNVNYCCTNSSCKQCSVLFSFSNFLSFSSAWHFLDFPWKTKNAILLILEAESDLLPLSSVGDS